VSVNTETGKVYTGADAIEAAKGRGEKLIVISERAARLLEEARANRAAALKRKRRARDRQQKASRRANRR